MKLKKEVEILKIEQINYSDDKKESLKQGFESIISSFNSEELNLIYIVSNLNKKSGVYIGVSRNYDFFYNEKTIEHKESAVGFSKIIKRKFESYFKGSKLKKLENDEISDLSRKLYNIYENDRRITLFSLDKENHVKKITNIANEIYCIKIMKNKKENIKDKLTMDKILSSYYDKNFIFFIIKSKGNVYIYLISDIKSTINNIIKDLKSIFEKITIEPLYNKEEDENLKKIEKLLHFNPAEEYSMSCNNINVISNVLGLPQNEIIGLTLKEEISFGLNIPQVTEGIKLARLLQDKIELDIPINLKKEDLNKHIFVTGVTGSGKTTTCKTLLKNMKLPYIVIEPAKTEYREFIEEDEEVVVFTVGEDLCKFYMNPFQLQENETIDSRVGMIKGAILSSFDLDAAIPQIIEKAIYRAYENLKWDINESKQYDEYINELSYEERTYPTFYDVINIIPEVVKEYKFSVQMEDEYIGSILSRLHTFITGGIKSDMYTVMYGIDFKDIVEKKVVFELDNIKDSNEKSFLIAMILANINQAVKNKHKDNKNYRHITLIEEAHRFLSKEEAGNDIKYEGIRIFTDMLAEVRKYGEGLIIVDQIPSKLISEVLKNTNTKIIHKIFSVDDKEAVGKTMLLNEQQMDYLSNLDAGEAVLFSYGWNKPILAKVINEFSGKEDVSEKNIEERIKKKFKKENFILKIRLINMIHQLQNFGETNRILSRLISVDELEKVKKIIEKDDSTTKTIKKINEFYSCSENLEKIIRVLDSIKNDLRGNVINKKTKDNKKKIFYEFRSIYPEMKDTEIIKFIDNLYSKKG